MIFKRRTDLCILLSLWCFITLIVCHPGDDFRFDTDDLQVVYTDAPETAINSPSRYIYTKELAQCPPGESKMMMTLLLRSLKWSDIGEKKKEKAIKKMSRFFLVPTKFIKTDDIHTTEMLEMLKHSINKSNNLLNTKETVGRVEFMIGCGDTLFANSKSLAHKVNDFVKSGKLEELSGLPFQWWNIWAKHVKSRVQRTRRQVEGSGLGGEGEGETDENEYYDEDDENEDEDEEIENEQLPPTRTTANQIEENFTTERMPPSSSASISTSSPHEHDTTLYSPITTIQTSAEIITTSTFEPFTTVSPFTTTPRVVDATVVQVATMVDKATTARSTPTIGDVKVDESNYDDEYDDELPEQETPSTTKPTPSTAATTQPTIAEIITQQPQFKTTEVDDDETSSISSTIPIESTSEIYELAASSTTEAPEDADYSENSPPYVAKRIKKLQATAGKAFSHKLDEAIFNDSEGGKDLNLELLDNKGEPLPSNSWIRFNADKQEIYGLPLEKDVSRHEFKLRATNKYDQFVDETVDVTVQQHKSFRSVNHEIYIQITLEKNYDSSVDWEIRLMQGIIEALEDDSIGSIVVRDVRPNAREDNKFTFIYSNDTLPKDQCPELELTALMDRLTKKSLNDAMRREISVRTVEKDLIGSCQGVPTTPRIPIPSNRNFPPTLRNHVDMVTATVGELLIFEVPADTFYDPEDQTDLKLTLLNEDRSQLDPNHWLQFDTKNREFYGVPIAQNSPKLEERYVLVAEDKSGLTANDALVVEIINRHFHQDYSATFKYDLDMTLEQFQTAAMKRKFVERVAQFFNKEVDQIIMQSVKKVSSMGRIAVVLQNTTLHNDGGMEGCPKDIEKKIRKLRNMLLLNDGNVQDGIKQALGSEFNVQKISVARVGKCGGGDVHTHSDETIPVDTINKAGSPFKIDQEILITYVLPATIILVMLLLALLIACLLYKRRSTGKMELGDEEERKSFRSRGIPVIFQDELDEKPEIVTKSPIILKDEKPPLLPQYNGLNGQDDDDLDQYIPPQGLPMMGSRESRGKSPVTPSYRKPPPYVSP